MPADLAAGSTNYTEHVEVNREVSLPGPWCDRVASWRSASALREGYSELVRKPGAADAVLERELARQASDEDHDLGLIVERLAWTPEERLEANAAFLRFYHTVRPRGPLIDEE